MGSEEAQAHRPSWTWIAVMAFPSSASESSTCTWLVPSTTTRRAQTLWQGGSERWPPSRWSNALRTWLRPAERMSERRDGTESERLWGSRED